MRRSAVAALVDVVAVVLFVAIGRASHHHSETVGGFLSTLWPFAVGVGVGWVVSSRRSLWQLRAGITVCLATVAVGMALRVVAGQGTALAFVVVALTFLGAVMVFGRVLAVLVIRPAVDRAPVAGSLLTVRRGPSRSSSGWGRRARSLRPTPWRRTTD